MYIVYSLLYNYELWFSLVVRQKLILINRMDLQFQPAAIKRKKLEYTNVNTLHYVFKLKLCFISVC